MSRRKSCDVKCHDLMVETFAKFCKILGMRANIHQWTKSLRILIVRVGSQLF